MTPQKHISSIITFLMTLNPTWNHDHKEHSDIVYEKQMTTPEKTIGIKKQGKKMTVGATAYYGDPITSTGTKPQMGRTIAVDPKVIPYGTRVYIPQFDKVFIAEDCGSAIKGNRIDIFMNTYDECMNWGFRHIDIYILK